MTMSTLEQSLDALLARESIRDLPNRYCDCVWRNDSAGIANLFAQDGSFTAISNTGETTITGRDNLASFFNGALDFKPRPYIHNHVIEQQSAHGASGRCYLDLRCASQDMGWIGAGYYEDNYVKTAEGWKFQTRRFYAVRMDEWPKNFEQ